MAIESDCRGGPAGDGGTGSTATVEGGGEAPSRYFRTILGSSWRATYFGRYAQKNGLSCCGALWAISGAKAGGRRVGRSTALPRAMELRRRLVNRVEGCSPFISRPGAWGSIGQDNSAPKGRGPRRFSFAHAGRLASARRCSLGDSLVDEWMSSRWSVQVIGSQGLSGRPRARR